MPANKQIDAVAKLDAPAEALRVRFKSAVSFGMQDSWYCSELIQNIGPTPGRATAIIPNVDPEEAANTIAFGNSAPTSILIGAQMDVMRIFLDDKAKTQKQTVFSGKITMIDRNRNTDALNIVAQDVRWDLKEVWIFGRYSIRPDARTPIITFQQGWPARFNPGGRPNRLVDEFGTPCFAPYPDYGLDGEEAPPPPEDQSMSQASYWTLGDIMKYLRKFYGPDAADGFFPYQSKAPADLIWPTDFASNIDAESVANFDNAVGQGNRNKGGARKGRDVNLEGVSLLDAFELLFSTAGGWTLAVDSASDPENEDSTKHFQSILVAVPSRYLGGGVDLPIQGEGDHGAAASITGGNFTEDGETYISGAAGRGGLVIIERRFKTDLQDLANELSSTILPGWAPDRFNAWRKAIQTFGNDPDGIAFSEANQAFPEVLATWQLHPEFNFQAANTLFENYPFFKFSRPPFPHQITTVQTLRGQDYAGLFWPVYVEVETGALGSGTWSQAGQFNGFELFDTGMMNFPALRERSALLRSWKVPDGLAEFPFDIREDGDGTISINSGTNTVTGVGTDFLAKFRSGSNIGIDGADREVNRVISDTKMELKEDYDGVSQTGETYGIFDGGVRIEERNIRINIALPLDHGVSAAVLSPSSFKESASDSDVKAEIFQTDESVDKDRISQDLNRTRFVDFGQLYQLWGRTFSYPRAQSTGAAQAEDKAGFSGEGFVRDDRSLLQGHLGRKVFEEGRLQKGGSLVMHGYLTSQWKPGTQVGNLVTSEGNIIPAKTVIKEVIFKSQDGNPPGNSVEFILA